MASRTIVTAPPVRAPQHSLLRSADTSRDGDTDWQRGLTYAPEQPGGYIARPYFCSDADAEIDRTTTVVAPVDYQPWELEVTDPCITTFGYDAAARADRLARQADAIESYAIARELWTGELAAASGDPNPSFARSTPTVVGGGGPVSARRALGLLEQAVGDALKGGQAMIHVSREARPQMIELIKQGNLLLTNVDNLIVADAGYPGTPPEGTAAAANVAWIYATGLVVVRRTPFRALDDTANQVIDTATNSVITRGSKMVAATFDPAVLFACPINLT